MAGSKLFFSLFDKTHPFPAFMTGIPPTMRGVLMTQKSKHPLIPLLIPINGAWLDQRFLGKDIVRKSLTIDIAPSSRSAPLIGSAEIEPS